MQVILIIGFIGFQLVISNSFLSCFGKMTPIGIGIQTVNYPIAFISYYTICSTIKTSINNGDNAVSWGSTYIDKNLTSMSCYKDGVHGTILEYVCIGY